MGLHRDCLGRFEDLGMKGGRKVERGLLVRAVEFRFQCGREPNYCYEVQLSDVVSHVSGSHEPQPLPST